MCLYGLVAIKQVPMNGDCSPFIEQQGSVFMSQECPRRTKMRGLDVATVDSLDINAPDSVEKIFSSIPAR